MDLLFKHLFLTLEKQVGIISTIIFLVVFLLIIYILRLLNDLSNFKLKHLTDHEGIKEEKDTFRIDIMDRIKGIGKWLGKLEDESRRKLDEIITLSNAMKVKQAALETALIKKETGREVISEDKKQKILSGIDATMYMLSSALYDFMIHTVKSITDKKFRLKMNKEFLDVEIVKEQKEISDLLAGILIGAQKKALKDWVKIGIPNRLVDIVDEINGDVITLGEKKAQDYVEKAIDIGVAQRPIMKGKIDEGVMLHLKTFKKDFAKEMFDKWVKDFEREIKDNG